MKNLILVLVSALSLNATAGPSLSGGVPTAPWTQAAAVFTEVLGYLNENGLTVISMAFAERNSIVNTTVICPDRTKANLTFKLNYNSQDQVVSLDKARSGTCGL